MQTREQFRLTALASCAGCAAKMRPGALSSVLSALTCHRTLTCFGLDVSATAAANSLGDMYAMGGRPILALVIATFPDTEGGRLCVSN